LQEKQRKNIKLARCCSCLGFSRQAVYQWKERTEKRAKSLEPVIILVHQWRRLLPRIGTRKLYYLLKPELVKRNIKLGRDGLFLLLKNHGLLLKPTKSYTKTTNSKHWLKKHPNLLKEWKIDHVEEAFVSDITYVSSDEGTHYLSLVTDAYSRKIMGYELSDEMKATDVVKALKMAIGEKQTRTSSIHHSDRGLQYCSGEYQNSLKKGGMRPSMTDGYDCYQNALAERVNGILKHEFLMHRCSNRKELEQLVRESIRLYNECRPHLSLDMQTPNAVHEKASRKYPLALI